MPAEIGKRLLEGHAQRRASVAIVVQVYLDLAHPLGAHLGERLEEAPVILLPREEVRVARRPPVGVPKRPCNLGVPSAPCLDAREPAREIDAAVERLVVIAESRRADGESRRTWARAPAVRGL